MPATTAPAVSVLMAVYNAGKYVDSAVRSVLAQTFTDFELVIVDDGSSDGSLAILEQLAGKDTRIRLSSQSNKGLVRTANLMTGLARGRVLSLMDHDDEMLPDCLSLQVAHLEAHPECIAVGVLDCYIDGTGRVTRKRANLAGVFSAFSRRRADFQAFPPVTPLISNPASMVRADAMRRAGGYREQFAYGNDIDLWFRLAETGEIHRLNRMLLRYRRHGANATLTRRAAIVMYDVVAHLSAIARHFAQDDAAVIAAFAGTDTYDVTRQRYLDLIGPRYPAPTFILFRAMGSGLPEVAGDLTLDDLHRHCLAHARSPPPSLAKLHLLRRTLARRLRTG